MYPVVTYPLKVLHFGAPISLVAGDDNRLFAYANENKADITTTTTATGVTASAGTYIIVALVSGMTIITVMGAIVVAVVIKMNK